MNTTTRRWPQRLIWITLFLTISFFVTRFYFRLTDDFRIAHLTYEMPYRTDWEIPPLSREEHIRLKAILSQPFSYIGKGAQSYAFVSQDKKYVLKFFKFKHLKPNKFVEAIPSLPYLKEYREGNIARKERLLNSVFSGYKLGYDVHRDECGLVYLHLNRSSNLNIQATLFDKIGRKHLLDLDPIVFVLQETARPTRVEMHALLNRGEIALAKHRIRQIFDLYLNEYRKGIYDRDHGVLHNTGFVGNKPIHLDIGKLTKEPQMKEPAVYSEDLEKVAIKYWVFFKNYHAEYYDEFIPFIEEELSQIFGRPFAFPKA